MSYSIDPNDVKDDLLPEGSYVVRIRGCGYGTTKGKGTPYQRIKGLIMAGPIDKLTDVNDAQLAAAVITIQNVVTSGFSTVGGEVSASTAAVNAHTDTEVATLQSNLETYMASETAAIESAKHVAATAA